MTCHITTKSEFYDVCWYIGRNIFPFAGLAFTAKKKSDRLTDDEVARLITLLRLRPEVAALWTTLELINHDLSRELDLSCLINLETLNLSRNQFTVFPKLYANAPLVLINLNENQISQTPYLPSYPRLRDFYIAGNRLTENFIDLDLMPQLRRLFAHANDFRTIPTVNLNNQKTELHFESHSFTHVANVLARAAHKHLGVKLFGFMRVKGGEVAQFSPPTLQYHFITIAEKLKDRASRKVLASTILRQHWSEMTSLLASPMGSKRIPLEVITKIFSYLCVIDPLRNEIKKFEQVFDSKVGMTRILFDFSRDKWIEFQASESFKILLTQWDQALLRYYQKMLSSIYQTTPMQNLSYFNHFINKHEFRVNDLRLSNNDGIRPLDAAGALEPSDASDYIWQKLINEQYLAQLRDVQNFERMSSKKPRLF